MGRATGVLDPMMATSSPLLDSGEKASPHHFSPENYCAERKYDGWLCRFFTGDAGDPTILVAGRNSALYSGQLPLIEESLIDILPAGTSVQGEIVARSGKVGDVQSAMTTVEPHCQDDMMFVIFDVMSVNGVDVRRQPWQERRRLVESIAVQRHPHRLSISELVEITEDCFEQALARGWEGLILKRKSSPYVHGKSSHWIKFKAQITVDAKIVALPHDGKGSFAGLVGAVEFALPDGSVGRASGMTLEVRKDMTFDPQKYLGRMAEFHIQEWTQDGRPRSPRWRRMRPDLDGGDAVIVQQSKPVETQLSGPAVVRARRACAPRMRNYKGMLDQKLIAAAQDLQSGAGAAYDKCLSRGGDPQEDLKVVQAELRLRGLALPIYQR